MPLEETVRIAHQIATGLEAAHARGVIHRDLGRGEDLSPLAAGGPVRIDKIAVGLLSVALVASLTVALLSLSPPNPGSPRSASDNPLAGARFSKVTDFEGSEFDATMRTFDITPDGRRIVFDQLSSDSDIVLIELRPST